jgi:hypothetical protein
MLHWAQLCMLVHGIYRCTHTCTHTYTHTYTHGKKCKNNAQLSQLQLKQAKKPPSLGKGSLANACCLPGPVPSAPSATGLARQLPRQQVTWPWWSSLAFRRGWLPAKAQALFLLPAAASATPIAHCSPWPWKLGD